MQEIKHSNLLNIVGIDISKISVKIFKLVLILIMHSDCMKNSISVITAAALSKDQALPTMTELEEIPFEAELSMAIDALANGQATGGDGIPVEIIKAGKHALLKPLHIGVKEKCVLAPTLFGIFFSVALATAFNFMEDGVYIYSRFYGKFFNLAQLKTKTKKHILKRVTGNQYR
ncbi:hypothetical protein HELRODRAFT_165023 [Helobdella robusta]|uniref:Uncharacterized protein n=1 Tax=Helobdella robusta TaxID=6412 RepID=T1EW56_HELRO|nr:hypothetical protein HELRODRAFT_165023 [Helobdella robusta]ESN92891.1 hypothetical protein HELRODRAFT_165023 [Helobdella robusta]